MIQEVGCAVELKPIRCVKVNPGFEILFRLMDGLCADTRRRHWISEHGIKATACGMGEDMGHIVKEVKISLTMSHKTVTGVEQDIQ